MVGDAAQAQAAAAHREGRPAPLRRCGVDAGERLEGVSHGGVEAAELREAHRIRGDPRKVGELPEGRAFCGEPQRHLRVLDPHDRGQQLARGVDLVAHDRAGELVVQDLAEDAEQRIASLEVQGRALTRNEQLFVKRMQFTRTSFNILDNYIAMTTAAATNADYRTAVKAGEQGLKAREEMAALGGIFTTRRLERGYPWWPGEVKQYRELIPYSDGPLGKLILKTPLEWAFHRTGVEQQPRVELATGAIDLTYWESVQATLIPASRKDYPAKWELLRTDQYAQAQGIRHPDRQSYTGHFWYRTDLTLTGKETEGAPHIRFPGLFNECWLYVNGKQVAHREQGKLWWRNDYRFEWDVELTGKLKAGVNTIALRCHCEHHLGGIFRRPFLYRAMR